MDIDTTERRNSDRFTYICRQLIADYDGVHFPLRDEFYKVVFQNISSSGIGFLSSKRPRTDHILVLLGRDPICFVARVVRTFFRADSSNMYEVGCEFTFRVAQPKSSVQIPSSPGLSLDPKDIEAAIGDRPDLCPQPWPSATGSEQLEAASEIIP